ncbi:MAG: ATP-dependent Clp protease proteolytic subunit, partial [Lachnospiraceae bacterium]|nr:ATP-dependent Clp protease proteolytic subunit [Lachnospiraceae bacterium]
PSSLIMIHKGWVFIWGGYNADELREMASENDAWDKMQVEIYKRKTGLSETVLMHMMSDTTYMTGREAKEKGFADEIIEDAEPLGIAASADGRSYFVRGQKFHLAAGMFMPDTVPTASEDIVVNPGDAPAASVETINQPEVTGREGGNSMTAEELRAQYPELVNQIEADARASVNTAEIAASAVQDERARLAAIDEVAHLFDANLVREARYGENACSAQELAYRAAQRAATQGQAFLTALEADGAASGAKSVNSAPARAEKAQEEKTPEELQEDANRAVSKLFEKEGK